MSDDDQTDQKTEINWRNTSVPCSPIRLMQVAPRIGEARAASLPGSVFMKQVFEEARKIREAERNRSHAGA